MPQRAIAIDAKAPPLPLDELRHFSSVQMLHRVKQQLAVAQRAKTPQNAPAVAEHASASTSRATCRGLALRLLLEAAPPTQESGAIQQLVDSLTERTNKGAVTAASPEDVATGSLVVAHHQEGGTPSRGRGVVQSPKAARGSGQVSPLRSQVEIQQIYHEIVERRGGGHGFDAAAGSGAQTPSPSPQPSPSASPSRNVASPSAQHYRASDRQRYLQALTWKKITYGGAHVVSAAAVQPHDRPTPRGRASSPDSPGGGNRAVSTALSSEGRAAGGLRSRDSMRASSPENNLSPSASLVRSSSSVGSFSLHRRKSSMNGSFSRRSFRGRASVSDMPSAEDVAMAFAQAQAFFRTKPLRSLAVVEPIGHDGHHGRLSRADGEFAAKRSTVAAELEELLFNCVLLSLGATFVSPSDGKLQDFLQATALSWKTPQAIEVTAVRRGNVDGASSDGELGGNASFSVAPQLLLRSFGCDKSLRWTVTSFSHLPRSSVMVAVACDAAALKFTEFPGTGRAGAAGVSTIVLGSKRDMLEHEALTTLLMEGMLGLEAAGRAVIEFRGPRQLQRTKLEFSEGVGRLLIAHAEARAILNTLRNVKRKILATEQLRRQVRSGKADMRTSEAFIAAHPPEYSIHFEAMISRALHHLAVEQERKAHHVLLRSHYLLWKDFASVMRTRASIQAEALGSAPVLLRQMMSLRNADVLLIRMQQRTLAEAYHVFFMGCMRRKQQRHMDALERKRTTRDEGQRSGGRQEVMVASAAVQPAKRLAQALSKWARSLPRGRLFPITLTGHSTGGAVALLAACIINADGGANGGLHVKRVVTFGAPKVFRSNATDMVQQMGFHHVAVVHEKDPAVHQPWNFDHTGLGAFTIPNRVPLGDASSPPNAPSSSSQQQQPQQAAQDQAQPSHSPAVADLRPTPWSELSPVPSTAAAHWLAFHCVVTYVASLAPDVTLPPELLLTAAASTRQHTSAANRTLPPPAASSGGKVSPELLEHLVFEHRALHPAPVRGASHGFSGPMMRCLQHIATRYGVGNQQRIPRDLILGILGMIPGAPLHLHVERVPVGQGGRIDQISFLAWVWQETVIDPRFLDGFLRAFTYEYHGKDFFPSQKAQVTPPPPPKILPAVAFCQADLTTMTTAARTAVESLFHTYARVFTAGPFEFSLSPETKLMSAECITQMLQNADWTHRCSPAEAVRDVLQQVAQEHVRAHQGIPKAERRRESVHRRLSVLPEELQSKTPLMSFGGEVTSRGFLLVFQLLLSQYGAVPLQNALWRLGYNRLWAPIVSRTVDISVDIHWKYGPCPCLRLDGGRARIHADEDRKFKEHVSRLAASAAMQRRKASFRVADAPMVVVVSSEQDGTTVETPPPVPKGDNSQWLSCELVSPSHSTASHTFSSAGLRSDSGTSDADRDEDLPHFEADPAPLLQQPPSALQHRRPRAADHQSSAALTVMTPSGCHRRHQPREHSESPEQPLSVFNSTFQSIGMYSNARTEVQDWAPTGNTRQLRRQARKTLLDFVRDPFCDTSVGLKPRRRVPPQERAQTSMSIRDPKTNSLPSLTTAYSASNIVRLRNNAQRKCLHLPALRNMLLDPPVGDPQLQHEVLPL